VNNNFDIKVSNNYDKLKVMGNDIINMYKSPNAENSLAKNIPLAWIKLMYLYSKKIKKLRFKYRGKSIDNGKVYYNRPTSFCHMKYAESFAIYER
tara:strand:- start:413 stop:697 length:285 start_codon:yes stop_codon:yes gene_type:complete